MRILIIAYNFPPFNTMGAVRVGKMAKYLTRFGHDVRVIAAGQHRLPKWLALEIDAKKVIYAGRSACRLTGLAKRIWRFGNKGVSWTPYARRAAEALFTKWQPDVIYASAMPYYPLLVAYKLWRKYRIPWIAEFRDLWLDNHYNKRQGLRLFVESRLEKKLLDSAAGLVTVSEPMAKVLNDKSGKPVKVIYNGFDPDDYAHLSDCQTSGTKLNIVYTGSLYCGKRDPVPLFEALKTLGPLLSRVSISFYGPQDKSTQEMIAAYGLEQTIQMKGEIPHQDSIAIQCQADILLLILWHSPGEHGVYTGKLFEYIGARRPILALGPVDNVAIGLIRQRGLGVACFGVAEIAAQLRYWLAEKERMGMIPPVPPGAGSGFTREEQARSLEAFIQETIRVNA